MRVIDENKLARVLWSMVYMHCESKIHITPFLCNFEKMVAHFHNFFTVELSDNFDKKSLHISCPSLNTLSTTLQKCSSCTNFQLLLLHKLYIII